LEIIQSIWFQCPACPRFFQEEKTIQVTERHRDRETERERQRERQGDRDRDRET
jgi:hypothetical protein